MNGTSQPVPQGRIRAQLQYLAPGDDGGAVYHASQAGGAAAAHDGQYRWHEVDVADARGRTLSLDREGFMLMPHSSAVTDFRDDAALVVIYEPEIDRLLRAVTGARRVHVFDHTRRAADDSLRRNQTMREPSSVIHNDYTSWSAEKRLAEILPDEAASLSAQRFAIVNVWRSIAGRVETMPLAFCDSTTVAGSDIVEVTRQARDRTGQIQMAYYNPAHRWGYFPHMAPDEVALIKTYDSARDGRNRYTIHTAFADPASAPDTAPRQSIESRAFLFF